MADQLLAMFAKFFNDERTSDVMIKVGEDELHCHSVILINRSPYFKAVFEGKMPTPGYEEGFNAPRDSVSGFHRAKIEIKDFTFQVISVLVEYLYTNDLTIDSINDFDLRGLYICADRYQVEPLRTEVESKIIESLSAASVCTELLGYGHKFPSLRKKMLELFGKEFNTISSVPGWSICFRTFEGDPEIFAEMMKSIKGGFDARSSRESISTTSTTSTYSTASTPATPPTPSTPSTPSTPVKIPEPRPPPETRPPPEPRPPTEPRSPSEPRSPIDAVTSSLSTIRMSENPRRSSTNTIESSSTSRDIRPSMDTIHSPTNFNFDGPRSPITTLKSESFGPFSSPQRKGSFTVMPSWAADKSQSQWPPVPEMAPKKAKLVLGEGQYPSISRGTYPRGH